MEDFFSAIFSGAGGVFAHRRRNLFVSTAQFSHRLPSFTGSSSFLAISSLFLKLFLNLFNPLAPGKIFNEQSRGKMVSGVFLLILNLLHLFGNQL